MNKLISIPGLLTAASIVLTGCTSYGGETDITQGGATNTGADGQLARALAQAEIAQAQAEAARAEANAAQLALAAASQSGGELFPPNALPGHCYARVFIPATYQQQIEQVLVKEAATRIEVVEPVFDWMEETQLVREASTRIEVIPAKYRTVTEQVLVKPESTRLVATPAEYQTISEEVIDEPAQSVWKRGSQYLDGALQTKTDLSTGEVMCLTEIPATYKTITRTVLVKPASVSEVVVPAEYNTITRTVVSEAASTVEVPVPAQYNTVRVLKQVQPASTFEIEIPAEYDTITHEVKASDELIEWREVLCDVNMTNNLVSELQRALHREGYFDSPVDGIYRELTQRGVNRYARSTNLPFGSNYVTLEVANALGLSY